MRTALRALRVRLYRLLYGGFGSRSNSGFHARLYAEVRAPCVNVVGVIVAAELVSRCDRTRSLWLENLKLSRLGNAVGISGVDFASSAMN